MLVEIIPLRMLYRRRAVSSRELACRPAIREHTEEFVAKELGLELVKFLRCHKDKRLVVQMKEEWDEGLSLLDEEPGVPVYDARVIIQELRVGA